MARRSCPIVVALLCLCVHRVGGAPFLETKHQVPRGFAIEKVAGHPEVVFPMFAVFDERGRLFVTESSGGDLYAELEAQSRNCRVRLLEDEDGDGRFERSSVYVDKLVFPMGLAWRTGKLYVADPPDLVVYEDHDGDKVAESRKVILSGFGHKDNGSLHGLIFGPDSLLYMTMGSPDGYRLRRADGTLLSGTSGALIRCQPDGTEPEVLCRGFENLVEVVFTPNGNIIGADNWFQLPNGGVRDALVHLVEGGRYPLDRDKGTNSVNTGDYLPAIALYPAVALSGMTLYRGRNFPPSMRENLYTAQHNSRKVGRHVLIPDGATYRAEDFEFVSSDDPDFHPSDVLEDADGSLLIVDTGGWYVQHCPTGKIRSSKAPGGIYRVWHDAPTSISDPWGRQIKWATLSPAELVKLLNDVRPAVRERAQHLLEPRAAGALSPLTSLLENSANLTSQQHALWLIATIRDGAAGAILRRALANHKPALASLAAQALALRKDREAAPQLHALLNTTNMNVRLAAAQSLAHCGNENSLPAIWSALADGSPDRILEHALIYTAHAVAADAALKLALRHQHPRVQKAALLLLDQRHGKLLEATAVLERVSAMDSELRKTALQILQKHPEWVEHAIGLVRARLTQDNLAPEDLEAARNLIVAFQSQSSMQQLVSEIFNRRLPPKRLQFLLECLADVSLRQLPPPWNAAIAQALEHSSERIRLLGIQLARSWPAPVLDEPLARIVDDEQASATLRLEALRVLVTRQAGLPDTRFQFLLEHVGPEASPASQLTAAEVLGRSRLKDNQLKPLLTKIRGNTLVSPSALLASLLDASPDQFASVVDYFRDSVNRGWRPADEELQKIVSRARSAGFQPKADALAEFLNKRRGEESQRLAAFEPLLKDGDETRGRTVFLGAKAACSTCHRVGHHGGLVGPDLTKIGAIRSGRDLIESIVFPSSTLAQSYERHSAVLKDGRELDGVIARQTGDALVLRDASGAETSLRKEDIQELKRSSVSLMPEGLDNALTRDEFRDLLAFLQSLR
ncbi:MAG: c-type cytochrome [Verrucomicrobia bacterium]|nr:c-type cytochrome [Verrucomicrobiota bacterium]